MKRLLTSAFAVVAVLGSGDAAACSCVGHTGPLRQQVEHAVQDADFVAEVEVVSTSTATETREASGSRWSWQDHQYHPYTEPQTTEVFLAQINILKRWKGSESTKEVSTGLGLGDCGLPLRAGQKLLLYAEKTDIADRVATGQCMRTALLSEAGADVALLEKFAANPVQARIFQDAVEVFSKYDPAFHEESVDGDLHQTEFAAHFALTGTLWIHFDAAANGAANGEVLRSDFVPDEAFIARLPQVIDGYYPGALISMTLRPGDDALDWAFGKMEGARLSHGNALQVSRRVAIVIRKFGTSIECDRRVYWATVESLTEDSTPLKAAAAPAAGC